MTHADLLAAIQLAYSRGDTRLLRMNSGISWQGDVVEHTANRLVLLRPRAVRLGLPGTSDLIGWTTGGIFCGLEIKTGTGRPSKDQLTFIELVQQAGGRAGIARSVEDAGVILTGSIHG